jgi:hypothetical protein
MEKPTNQTPENVLQTPDGQFFVDRLCSILMMQVEQEALEKSGSNGDETLETVSAE